MSEMERNELIQRTQAMGTEEMMVVAENLPAEILYAALGSILEGYSKFTNEISRVTSETFGGQ